MAKRDRMRRRIAAAGFAIAVVLAAAVGCQRKANDELPGETAVVREHEKGSRPSPEESSAGVPEKGKEDSSRESIKESTRESTKKSTRENTEERSRENTEKSSRENTKENTKGTTVKAEAPEEWMQEASFISDDMAPARAEGFVELAEAAPDVIQEIRYYSTYNFVGERIDGYERPVALLTKEAASALKLVSDDVMEQGYRLKVYDAYRPQRAVDHFVRWAKDVEDTRMKPYFYPEIDKNRLFDQGYISARSGHSRGSTVDLTLFDMKTGKEADMGGVFDYFGRISHPDYVGELTKEQQNNRNILRAAMMRHGFKPISTEWWHFTLREEPYPNTYFDFPVN